MISEKSESRHEGQKNGGAGILNFRKQERETEKEIEKMKIERLYAITIYLLNHGRTSASELAKHFEVSVRTIQRDIDSLSIAGIPVAAVAGAAGGYEITERFKMEKQFATPEDYSYILTALQGLVTATDDRRARNTLEKVAHLSGKRVNRVILDFSVLREGDQTILQTLQSAIREKRVVRFQYTNNNCETRIHRVEPIAVIYRWYAWYLLAYSKAKKDYRTYKLVRMCRVELEDDVFCREHETAEHILEKMDKTDTRRYVTVRIRCKEAVRARAVEYLNGKIVEEYGNGDIVMELMVPENEQFWFGTVLAMGNQAEVLAPEEIREHLLEAAQEIVSLYKEL